MTPAELQQLESSPPLRIKFASVGEDGSFASDATLDDYQSFFRDLQEASDWKVEPTMMVQTRREYQRSAHILRHGQAELALVEHETGMEIIFTDVAANLASAAIISLVTWGWMKWKEVRTATAVQCQVKVEPTFMLERIVARDSAGKSTEIVRVEKRGPLFASAIGKEVENFIVRLGPSGLRQADGHVWKLWLIYGFFVLEAVIGLGAIVALAIFGGFLSDNSPWPHKAILAWVGGWLGGLARTLYFFSFDAYAFNHRLRTKESSKWAGALCKNTLDDKFDPVWVWYLWCFQPLVGGMAGLVFALAIDFGLITLGGTAAGGVNGNYRILVLGLLSGFFSEVIFERIRTEIDRRGART